MLKKVMVCLNCLNPMTTINLRTVGKYFCYITQFCCKRKKKIEQFHNNIQVLQYWVSSKRVYAFVFLISWLSRGLELSFWTFFQHRNIDFENIHIFIIVQLGLDFKLNTKIGLDTHPPTTHPPPQTFRPLPGLLGG